jgi:phenylacetic acid degradation operon negative regulatory protein
VASPEVIQELLVRHGVQGKLLVCRSTELAGVAGRPLRELAAEGWDLSGVVEDYRGFIAQFNVLLATLQQGEALAPEQAFVIRTLLIHAYRRVQLHDPMLPVELLPDPWPGSEAYELARALYRLTQAAAEAHILAALQREDAEAPGADAAFYQRFGGL